VLAHRLGDVLEADGGLVDRVAVGCGDAVDDRTGRDGPDHVATAARVVVARQQIVVHRREEEIRVEEAPLRRDDADAVGIAVVDDPEVGVAGLDPFDQVLDPFRHGFRRAAAELWVAVTAQADEVGTGPLQQAVRDPAAAPVHRIVGDGQAVEVDRFIPSVADELDGVVEVRVEQVPFLDSAPLGLGKRIGFGQRCHDRVGRVGQRGRPVAGHELHAVVLRGIVRGRHHQRAGQPFRLDRPGDDGRGRVTLGQQDVETVGTEHAGQFLRESPGVVPGVVADGDRLAVAALVSQVRRDRLADHADPLVGELVERRSPAVGAEGDGLGVGVCHGWDCDPGQQKAPVRVTLLARCSLLDV
jgi:hypothetical protein